MKTGSKLIAIVLLFIGLVLVNYLTTKLPLRFDATAEHIYTLSAGSKALLAKIGEPITLDLYFSKDSAGQIIEYKNYAERVREMLRQYVRGSHGKIVLNVIDPEPDTNAEEKATSAGLAPQKFPGSTTEFYFGLVATQADQQKALPSLTPQREQFLEYDISELIYGLQQTSKKKLGLITSLPLMGSALPPGVQGGAEGQYVTSEWEETYQIVPVEASASELPSDLSVLAIVHPQKLSAALQFAIDQFVLSGKPAFIAVDPSSEYFRQQAGQMSQFGPQPNVSSDLPVLLGGWGISFDPQLVVGDLDNAQDVQLPNGPTARYPVWISLSQDNFNPKALPTAQLTTALFIEPGSLSLKKGSSLSFTPLIETSERSGTLASMALQFAQPDDVAKQIIPTGKKTLAALVTGRFLTAFPDGAPKDEAPGEKGAVPAKPAPFLKESRETSTLIVVADTDWLMDDYAVHKFDFLGQAAAEPRNDNLAFAANALDFLSGSQDLLSIRGKGNSLRPFTVVRKMEAIAAERYKEKIDSVESRLAETQGKLNELLGTKNEGNHLIASPEVARAIEDFQKQQAGLKAERRKISLKLREGIDALENTFLVINLLACPLLICGFGLFYQRHRRG